jgi:hypothetical protein
MAMTLLKQLRDMTIVVADSGDVDSITRFKPPGQHDQSGSNRDLRRRDETEYFSGAGCPSRDIRYRSRLRSLDVGAVRVDCPQSRETICCLSGASTPRNLLA